MQISSASLLAAQQQASVQPKPQASVFGSFLKAPAAAPKEAAKPAFEPVDFAKAGEPQGATAPSAPDQPQAFRPPGSTVDIRV